MGYLCYPSIVILLINIVFILLLYVLKLNNQTSYEMGPTRLSDISTLKKLPSWPEEDTHNFKSRNALPTKVSFPV